MLTSPQWQFSLLFSKLRMLGFHWWRKDLSHRVLKGSWEFVQKFLLLQVKSLYRINMILSKLIVLIAQCKLDCWFFLFLGDTCRWAGIVQALCSSNRHTSPAARTGCYEIKPEVGLYSPPQSFKQTKKTVNSNLCSFKSLLYCDAYKKLRRKR